MKQRGQTVLHTPKSSNSMQIGAGKSSGSVGKAYLSGRVGSLDVHNGPHQLSIIKQ